MSAAHTPGPWEAAELGDYGDYEGNCRVILGDDIRVAVVLHGGREAMRRECDANARLIAAAPELYEALDEALDALVMAAGENVGTDDQREAHRRLVRAEAALRKARGEQP